MSNLHVLCIDGSPKTGKTNSRSLVNAWGEALRDRGAALVDLSMRNALQSEEGRQEMLAKVDAADVIALALPLYVDTVPANVMEAFELIHAHRMLVAPVRTPRLVAIVNGGFPEAWHCDLALEVCQHFADASHMVWAGGLAIGMGPLLRGRPLSQVKEAAWVQRAIEIAAREVADGGFVPSRAIEYARRPMIAPSVYWAMTTLMWHVAAWQNGCWRKRRARPFPAG